jgi:SEC-C motif
MSLVPRNAPCPCGSGLKYRRCCLDREPELLRRAEALEVLAGLGSLFPLLRPDSPKLEAWLDARDEEDVTREMIEEAGSLLGETERERIARAHAQEFPEVWRGLVEDLGDETEAEQVVLVGAIAAALGERHAVDPLTVELIERAPTLADDHAEALALALDATALCSVAEATVLDDLLAQIPDTLDEESCDLLWNAVVDAEADRLWSERRDRRLRLLVTRLRAQLPIAERPKASTVLAAACTAFEHDEAVRKKLAANLLADSVSWQSASIASALAA